ncbi:unannotated protein [freshwater metagenome]|uniref:Unannotated protein n=1 Tax=freshwater metagenome TaxID=449393 RepID=A0A6J7BIH0_9ZZZZ
MVTWPRSTADALRRTTGPDGPDGTTDATVAAPNPKAVRAKTEKLYCVPGVSPEIVNEGVVERVFVM